MHVTKTVGLSLIAAKEMATKVDRLSLLEGKHTRLLNRVAVQARSILSAYAVLESAGVLTRASRWSQAMRGAPVAFCVLEMGLSLVASRVGAEHQGVQRAISMLRRRLPQVLLGALLTATAVGAIAQPLSGVALLVYGLAMWGERRGWVSPRLVSCLGLLSTVSALGMGLAFGSWAIRGLLVAEVLSFVIMAFPQLHRKLGLLSHSQRVTGLPVEQMRQLTALAPRQRASVLLQTVEGSKRALSAPSPSIWTTSEGLAPPSAWTEQVDLIAERLGSLQAEVNRGREEEQRLRPLLERLHLWQSCDAVSTDEIREGMPLGILNRQRAAYQTALAQCRAEILSPAIGRSLGVGYPPELFQRHLEAIDRAFDERNSELLEPVQAHLGRVQEALFNRMNGADQGWLRGEIAEAARELQSAPGQEVRTILTAFRTMHRRALKGRFGPGSLKRPEQAQCGWGHTVAALSRMIQAGSVSPQAMQETQRGALRAITQMVLASESCSSATLRAIQECHDTACGHHQLQIGFHGWLRSIRSQEAASWYRTTFLGPVQRLTQRLGQWGVPGMRRLSGRVGIPSTERALSGVEVMPWLDTSYGGATQLTRARWWNDWALAQLGTQVVVNGSRSSVEARLQSPKTLMSMASHYLMQPEGRSAWHRALQRPDFRAWVATQTGAPPDRLVLPEVGQGSLAEAVRQDQAYMESLWVPSLLLLQYCGCLQARSQS